MKIEVKKYLGVMLKYKYSLINLKINLKMENKYITILEGKSRLVGKYVLRIKLNIIIKTN